MSSIWTQYFFYKSATAEFCERVLPAHYKGGVTYLFLQLKIMFVVSCDIINALRKYLKLFEDKVLHKIQGKSS